MFKNKIPRNIFYLWLVWILIVIAYQAWAGARLSPQRPDHARPFWPEEWTSATAQQNKPYLIEPFMNRQVSWDSEYYLSIAIAGYNDPLVSKGEVDLNQYDKDPANDNAKNIQPIALSYAYLPFYPAMIRLFVWPLKLLGLNPIATASLAAVIVSALGTLGGMAALHFLARDERDESQAWRAVFYLMVFPSAFFLLMAYTEGLFVGLAFGSLALLKQRKWLWAALLAACAVLTRSIGVALVVPMAFVFCNELNYRDFKANLNRANLSKAAWGILPVMTFLLWKFSTLGFRFDIIQAAWFERGFMKFGKTWASWSYAWNQVAHGNGQSMAYHLMEMVFPAIALAACGFTLNKHPEATLFSLAAILLALFSGDIQSMYRYMLATPALFIYLGQLGKNQVFDRGWSLASTLLLGMNAYLFAMDMWAG